MKKRILAMAVCAALLLSLCGCGAKQVTETTTEASKTETTTEASKTETTTEASKTETTTESTASDAPDTPDNTLPEETDAGTVIDCGTDLAKAAELVHFELKIPELSNYTVSVIGGETIDVSIPIDTDNDIYVRMRMNCDSIEKVTSLFWEIEPVIEDWNGRDVTALKEGDTYYSLGYGAGVGYYGVTCTTGMDKDSLYSYLESLYNANKSVSTFPSDMDEGTVIDCGTDLAKAAEIVHFELKIPELSNYTVSVIDEETIDVSIPIDTDNDIYVRMRMNCDSIEKVTSLFWEIDPVIEDWNGIEVTALKEGDTYYSLGFGAEIGYYGVTCTNGMDKDSLYGYLESLYNANKPGELPIPD